MGKFGDRDVTLVIPCYNYKQYTRQAIISALNQTYPCHIVVVDDVSIDGTKELLKGIEAEILAKSQGNGIFELPEGVESSTTYEIGIHSIEMRYNSVNKGMIGNVNQVFSENTSPFLFKLDADDMIFKTTIADLVQVMQSNPQVGVAYARFKLFGEQNFDFPGVEYDLSKLKQNNFIPSFSLIRREAWLAANKFKPEFTIGYDDWDLWLSMAEKGWYGKLLPQYRCLYRRHGESMDTNAQKKYGQVVKLLKKFHPELYSDLSVTQMYNIGGYPGEPE